MWVYVCAWVCLFTCVSICVPVCMCGCMNLYVCCLNFSITSTHGAMTAFSTRLNKVILYMITNWVSPERHDLGGNPKLFHCFCMTLFLSSAIQKRTKYFEQTWMSANTQHLYIRTVQYSPCGLQLAQRIRWHSQIAPANVYLLCHIIFLHWHIHEPLARELMPSVCEDM